MEFVDCEVCNSFGDDIEVFFISLLYEAVDNYKWSKLKSFRKA